MKLTIILVALCVAGFALGVAYPASNDYLGFSLGNLAARPYVLITSIFMHGSLDHLLSNLLVLAFFGIAVESELGWRKTLVVFMMGAFAGDLISLIVYAPGEISVGASAGIFALIGIGMLLPADISSYPAPVPLAFLGLAYAIYNAYGFVVNADPQISYIAHFGGLFAGLLFGLRQEKRKNLKIVLAMFLAMIIIPLLWILIRHP